MIATRTFTTFCVRLNCAWAYIRHIWSRFPLQIRGNAAYATAILVAIFWLCLGTPALATESKTNTSTRLPEPKVLVTNTVDALNRSSTAMISDRPNCSQHINHIWARRINGPWGAGVDLIEGAYVYIPNSGTNTPFAGRIHSIDGNRVTIHARNEPVVIALAWAAGTVITNGFETYTVLSCPVAKASCAKRSDLRHELYWSNLIACKRELMKIINEESELICKIQNICAYGPVQLEANESSFEIQKRLVTSLDELARAQRAGITPSPVNHDRAKGIEKQRVEKLAEIKAWKNKRDIGPEGTSGPRGQYRLYNNPGRLGKGSYVPKDMWDQLAAEHKENHTLELEKDLADIDAKLTQARELETRNARLADQAEREVAASENKAQQERIQLQNRRRLLQCQHAQFAVFAKKLAIALLDMESAYAQRRDQVGHTYKRLNEDVIGRLPDNMDPKDWHAQKARIDPQYDATRTECARLTSPSVTIVTNLLETLNAVMTATVPHTESATSPGERQ